MLQARLGGARVVQSVMEVVRVAGGAGTRDLFCRGGQLRLPLSARHTRQAFQRRR
jgi:hypothetical protein